MRAVVILIYLCTFLLSGGQVAVANGFSAQSTTNVSKEQLKFSNPDQGFLFVEDTDFDSAEEPLSIAKPQVLALKSNYHFASGFIGILFSNPDFPNGNYSTTQPFSGNSPIYITLRVLRI